MGQLLLKRFKTYRHSMSKLPIHVKNNVKNCSDFNILVQNFTTLYNDITFSSKQLSPDHINDTKSSMIDTTNSQFDLSYTIVNESLYDLIVS